MKTDTPIKSKSLPIDTYLNIMSGIEFMQPYSRDPDIFNPESGKLNNFLIQSFCYLHPDFHYLSFLNSEDIDMEIIKAAGILQIFPTNNNNNKRKLFDDMCTEDIHKFWLKFFSLFKKQEDFSTDSIYNISWINKISFFNDMNSTLNYLNYQFPVVHGNKFNDCVVNKELDTWKGLKDEISITSEESVAFNFDENKTTDLEIDNLIAELQQVVTVYSNKKIVCQENKPKHADFFVTFVSLTKNILQYKNNLKVANSKFLDEHSCKLFANYENMPESLYFIKKCNNTIKTLKSEMKF